MSKRPCPFSDGTPQSKTCVKDEAAGGEAEKSAVYEHTRALFSSAPAVSPAPSHRRGSARGGQTRLGPRGELLRSQDDDTGAAWSSPACTLCERPLLNSAPCVRCEKVVCGHCQRQCSLCFRTHCFICCRPNYSERYERLVCVDCSRE